MPQLIALHGPAGSGKTYCGDIFVQRYGFARVKFADPLKNMLRAFLQTAGVTSENVERYIEGDLKEEPCHYLSGASPRRAMQTLGGEWGRDLIDADLWANAGIIAAMRLIRHGHSVVIDDCRYENEAENVLLHAGRVIQIVRPMSKMVGNHKSEKPLPGHLITDTLNNFDRATADLEVRRLIREGSIT